MMRINAQTAGHRAVSTAGGPNMGNIRLSPRRRMETAIFMLLAAAILAAFDVSCERELVSVSSWIEFPRRNVSSPLVKLILIAIAIGLVAGLLGALCGVGGGIVMVPAFVALLGLGQKEAVATSLAVVIVTALAATANNARAGGDLINWKIVAAVGLASAITAWFGSDLMRSLSNQTLTRTFGVVLVLFGARMLIKG